MTRAQIVKASNEWMRRYTEAPERFEAEFRTVALFLAQQDDGSPPTYGENVAAYLEQLSSELEA